MAEQDGLDQVFRDGAAVYGDEGLAGALGRALDAAGDNFLARAAFAEDEDGDVAGGRTLAHFQDLAHGRRAGDHVLEGHSAFSLAGKALHLARERAHLQGVADGDDDPLGAGGLDEEVDGAGAHGLDDRVDPAGGGEHDDRQVRAALGETLQRFHARQARHDQVEQDDIHAVLGIGGQGKAAFAVRRGAAGKARFLHRRLQQPALRGIVIDYQNRLRHTSCPF